MRSENEFLARKIAVTGATGMVGSHLVAALVTAGYTDITLLVHNAKHLSNLYLTLGRLHVEVPKVFFTVVETDLDRHEALEGKLKDVDTLFNCAARIMSGDMTPEQLIEHNLSIARTIVNWCVSSGVRKLIHVSSIAALGETNDPAIAVDETSEPTSVEHYSAYGRSKYYSEQEVWRGAAEGLEVVVVSPAVILGEGDAKGNNSAALIPFVSSGIPFYTMGIMSYVDVRDVAQAMVLLDGIPQASGERFLLAAGSLSYKELITLGAKAAGRPRPFIRVGSGLIAFAYGAMKVAVALGVLRAIGVTKEILGSVLRSTLYDGTKITRLFGFQYTPLSQSVERVVIACRNQGVKN